jgi:hypothetical protein
MFRQIDGSNRIWSGYHLGGLLRHPEGEAVQGSQKALFCKQHFFVHLQFLSKLELPMNKKKRRVSVVSFCEP